MASDDLSSYSNEDSVSFWSLRAAGGGRGDRGVGEPLSGTDEVFDPATGWDFAAVSDADLRAVGRPRGAESPTVRDAVSNLPDWGAPSLGDEPEGGAAAPLSGPSFSDLPIPGSPSREESLPDLEGLRAEPAVTRLSTAAPEPGLPDARPRDLSFAPEVPTQAPPRVAFDPDGFFSVADVPSPVQVTLDGDATPPPQSLEESAEFEIEVDEEPVFELEEEDIYSQSALPAVPPELAILPVEEAVERARELFADDDPALGMAVLEAARMRAPADTRVETWLEFGERRLIARYAPEARPDRIPVLLHPTEKLLRVTGGDQAALIAAVDGRRTLTQLRRALPQLPLVGFWKDIGKLLERGWLGWVG